MFTLVNNTSNAVISSLVTEDENSYVVKMQLAKLQRNDAECDVVKVYDIEYVVDKLTGTIQKTTKMVNELSSILWGAGPMYCTN